MSRPEPNAETYRLLAVAKLMKGNWIEARQHVQMALEKDSRALPVRFLAAMIDYYSSLISMPEGSLLLNWPPPVPWEMIKQDEDSHARLRKATDTFKAFLDENLGSASERDLFEVWFLACLANDPGKQEEAAIYCKQALAKDPSRALFIAWALERQYPIDLFESRRALEHRIEKGDYGIPEICAMVAIALAQGDAPKAEETLERYRDLFSKDSQEAVWTFWKTQVKAVTGDLDGAITLLSESSHVEQLGDLYARLLMQGARRTGDRGRALAFLEQEYARTRDPQFLLMLCEIKADLNEWESIVEQANVLLEKVPGPSAVRLVAFALYNTNRYEECQDMLVKYGQLFQEGKLPSDLRKIQSRCLGILGKIPESLLKAESIALEEDTPNSWLELAKWQAMYGDLQGVQRSARQLVKHPLSTVPELLETAGLVRIEHMALARDLWKRCAKMGIPDKCVPSALSLAFELGLDTEAGPLMHRLQRMGGALPAGMEVKSFQETIEFITERSKSRAELESNYRRGQAPIHLAAQIFPFGLSFLFHVVPALNQKEAQWRHKYPLYIRHGSRWIPEGAEMFHPGRPLIMDITAILLARHLGLLEAIQEVFPSILLPESTMAALCHLKEQALPHQPSRIEARKVVMDLVERGQLKEVSEETSSEVPLAADSVWDPQLNALLGLAHEKNGKVVAFLPLMKSDMSGPIEGLSQSVQDLLMDDRAVLDALRKHGPLSEDEYLQALRILGREEEKAGRSPCPEKGKPLFLVPTLAEHLASIGILGALCNSYSVFLTQCESQDIRNDRKRDEVRTGLQQWIGDLIEDLALGLADKKYLLLPPPKEKPDAMKDTSQQDPVYQCLMNAIHHPLGMNANVWCEDRLVSSFSSRLPFPVIGILEILQLLRAQNLLSEREYFEKLIEVRDSDCRFIPIEKDEIIFHLAQAGTNEKALVETHALRVLRQYVAACFLEKESLAPPKGSANPGEARFVIQYMHAVTDAIILTWKDSTISNEQKEARANWLLANLYMDIPSLKACLGWPHAPEEEAIGTAVSLAGLIGRTVDFASDLPSCRSLSRKACLKWLYRRLIRMKIENDPGLLEAIAISLRSTLLDILDGPEDPKMRAASRKILQGFNEDMPWSLRKKLIEDDHFAHAMGIKKQSVITVGGVRFAIEEFYRAAHDAHNGAVAQIQALDSSDRYEMMVLPAERGPSVLEIKSMESGLGIRTYGNGLESLSDAPIEREKSLEKNRPWYDCAVEDLRQIDREIASREKYQDRVGALQAWTETSAVLYYARFEEKLEKVPSFHFLDMRPPSVLGLLRHLRLSADGDHTAPFSNRLDEGARLLVKEDGLLVAFWRLAVLPVALPKSFLTACESLALSERRNFVKKVLASNGSPLALLHLVRVLTIFSKDWPTASRLASRVIRFSLSKNYLDSLKSLGALLDWAVDDSPSWPGISDVSSHLRLAMIWIHAGEQNGILARTGAPSDWIEEVFRQNERLPVEILWPDGYRPGDAAYPKGNIAIPLAFAGLAYAMGAQKAPLQPSDFRHLFEPLALIKTDQLTLPVASLLKDPSLGSNDLESFLGADRGRILSEVMQDESPQVISSSFLEALATTAITALEGDATSEQAWLLILSIIGNRRIYESLRSRFSELLGHLDLAEIHMKNELAASFAMEMIAFQSVHLPDDAIRAKFLEQVLKVAGLAAAKERGALSDEQYRDIFYHLFDSGLRLCQTMQERLSWHLRFSEYLGKVIRLDEAYLKAAHPFVQRLCEELPTSDSKHYAPLLLLCRGAL